MNNSYIIDKMNEYMSQLSNRLGAWLKDKLSKFSDKWWNELVVDNLTLSQREIVSKNNINDINAFDLEVMLRIFDRNWFVITSAAFIDNSERYNIKKMQEVCNFWNHTYQNDITKKRIIDDVETIISLMRLLGSKMSETRDMENFIFDVQEDNELDDTPIKFQDIGICVDEMGAEDIVVGSIVNLISDKSVIGAVIGINADKYSVLIGTSVQTFYREQIQLQDLANKKRKISVKRARTALTAYQINNPSSGNLYSLNSARIDFVPYQFRPALKIIKSDKPRLLIADDVGVGKTIEAGLILKELEARFSINSVLIICPRPLVAERKWELEMRRFDENFTQMDGRTLISAISETDRDGEWPERHKKTIIPYSLFSEDSINGRKSGSNKKHKNIGLAELDPLPHFDLIIVDEAHNIRNSNTWMYKGVELFCQNADAIVFLTATPLQNSNNDLYTLLNLLRPDIIVDKETFNMMSEPNVHINELLRVIRMQNEGWQQAAENEILRIFNTSWGRNVIQHSPDFARINNIIRKEFVTRDEKVKLIGMIEKLHSFNSLINRTRRKDIEDFCIRRTITVRASFNEVQHELYEALMKFESSALAKLHGSNNVRFMMCTIMRQAASCIYGIVPFLDDFMQKRMDQIQMDGELYEHDFDMDGKTEKYLYSLMEEISDLSQKLPKYDDKFENMFKVISEKQNDKNNRVIVFSSFRHTLAYIKMNLIDRGVRVEQIDGSVPDEERRRLRSRFLLERDNEDAIDVLLFSEVGCEGLDYQFCDTMINYDLPWNPMRIEQRIGRIDRRGQKSDIVKIYNMITENSIDEVIYDRCLNKIGVFESSIGDCSEILGDISEQISKIMFDSELTEEERKVKIEQMADNELMKINEMYKLEQEEKSLFGFDLSNYIQNKNLHEAENIWITPESMHELAVMFMNDLFGEGEYMLGKSSKKTIRLSVDKRRILLDNLNHINIINNNNASKLWRAYLKSNNNPALIVTFDSSYAKENDDVVFLTQMHPFIIQAADYESRQFPCKIGLSVYDDSILEGEYAFLIYAWKYIGFNTDVRIMAVSENKLLKNNILSYLQFADDYNFNEENYISKWEDIDKLHYKEWQEEKNRYKQHVKEECDYRIEQLNQSRMQIEMNLRSMLNKVADERIIRMKQSQLDKLSFDRDEQNKRNDEVINRADIYTELLIKGVLYIRN
ncbi:MAG: DEAD/DEAH box helicase [Firmicutes bacterium]|nr:DEAD/DEAH box helicase [Bacillota bacterium]